MTDKQYRMIGDARVVSHLKKKKCFPVLKNTLAATSNKSCAKLFSKTQSEREGSEGCASEGLEVARGKAAGVASVCVLCP